MGEYPILAFIVYREHMSKWKVFDPTDKIMGILSGRYDSPEHAMRTIIPHIDIEMINRLKIINVDSNEIILMSEVFRKVICEKINI